MPKKQLKTSDAQILFAENVKKIRMRLAMTQEQVAEAADLHPNYVSSVERGERNISIGNIERIARALQVPMYRLLQKEVEVLETDRGRETS